MIGASREKLTLFITVAVDGNALSDVCGLNLQYHRKTVSRQCKKFILLACGEDYGRKSINNRNRITGEFFH